MGFGQRGHTTIVAGSPASNYNLAISVTATSAGRPCNHHAATAAGAIGTWVVNDSANPPINRATRDWHADFMAQCASSGLEVSNT